LEDGSPTTPKKTATGEDVVGKCDWRDVEEMGERVKIVANQIDGRQKNKERDAIFSVVVDSA